VRGDTVPFIDEISDEEATGRVAEMFRGRPAEEGYVWDLSRVFGHRPGIHDG
jgi:hypothetical protein